MLRSTLIAAALIAAAAMPAYSASMSPSMPMSKCDDASMASMQGKIDGMTDKSHQKMAMKEMTMAKTSMKAHKLKSCGMHMDKAMKDMGTM